MIDDSHQDFEGFMPCWRRVQEKVEGADITDMVPLLCYNTLDYYTTISTTGIKLFVL